MIRLLRYAATRQARVGQQSTKVQTRYTNRNESSTHHNQNSNTLFYHMIFHSMMVPVFSTLTRVSPESLPYTRPSALLHRDMLDFGKDTNPRNIVYPIDHPTQP